LGGQGGIGTPEEDLCRLRGVVGSGADAEETGPQ
jgi:hypothetical protein